MYYIILYNQKKTKPTSDLFQIELNNYKNMFYLKEIINHKTNM